MFYTIPHYSTFNIKLFNIMDSFVYCQMVRGIVMKYK